MTKTQEKRATKSMVKQLKDTGFSVLDDGESQIISGTKLTKALHVGKLDFWVFGAGAFGRFSDVQYGRELTSRLGERSLVCNTASGKWNFYYSDGSASDIRSIVAIVQRLLAIDSENSSEAA